jgi:hypothetical protein
MRIQVARVDPIPESVYSIPECIQDRDWVPPLPSNHRSGWWFVLCKCDTLFYFISMFLHWY